jgi:hypothetical protein
MKVLKILGIVVGVLVALIGGFFAWFYFAKVKAPEPAAYCAHVEGLMRKDLPAEIERKVGKSKMADELVKKQIDEFAADCVKDAERRKTFHAVNYATEAKCAVAAGTFQGRWTAGRRTSADGGARSSRRAGDR